MIVLLYLQGFTAKYTNEKITNSITQSYASNSVSTLFGPERELMAGLRALKLNVA